MMKAEAIANLLGQLQSDPDAPHLWEALVEAITSTDRDVSNQDLEKLVAEGIVQHKERGEWTAVAHLLEIALSIAEDESHRVAYIEELANVCDTYLFSTLNAERTWQLLLQRMPNHPTATTALAEIAERRGSWQQMARNYSQEAQAASDDVYRSSMLMRAAEMELRYAPESNDERIIENLEQAVRLDASNTQAGRMLERLYRRTDRWEEVARVIDRMATRANDPNERKAAAVRLARLYRYRLEDGERAAMAYERLLREQPGHAEALAYLADLYSSEKRWEELVALYEQDLSTRDLTSPQALGNLLQIAMLHYKVRGNKADAEPWFERIRKVDPAHEGMLEFFREYCHEIGDESRWIDVLQGAQRVMPDGKVKARAAVELAELAEKQTNAQRAIEQYRTVLRQDPNNESARDALKRLLKATQGFTTLVELLRQQLEHTPAEEYEKRLEILREVAGVYRQYLKNDTALVTVLHQIVMLDERLDAHDVEELRELVSLYDKLGRHRELLTYQLKLAEVSPDIEEKAALYRAAARRWLDQFSNFQNATEAYEALLKVAPRDPEAMERLNELYRKRRSWPQLFDLLSQQVDSLTGPQKVSVLWELAQLAADRLHKLDDATRLYRQLLELDGTRVEVIDALEKHAERNKDWQTLAFVLERRADLVLDPTQQSAILQKLGAVYQEHLQDTDSTVRTWRRVLALQPGHPRALRVLRDTYLQNNDFDGLTELYASQSDWDGLVEVLGNTADRATDARVRLDLSYRAAAIFENQLHQPQRAFRSYERILAADPNDVRAAKALIPLYEIDEKWSRLPPLYELLLARSEDEEEQLELLTKLIETTGRKLLDRKAAFTYARRAFEAFPQNESVRQMLEHSARAGQMWDGLLEALDQRVAAVAASVRIAEPEVAIPEPEESRGKKKGKKKPKRSEPEAAPAREPEKERESESSSEQRGLMLTQARILSDELARIPEAVEKYREVLQKFPTDTETDPLLEKLLTTHNRIDDLRWLFEHRVGHAANPEEAVAILARWAELERTTFKDNGRAIELYRRILKVDEKNDPALAALSQLLLDADQLADAAEVLELRRQNIDGSERVELEVRLAELYAGRLQRPADALNAAVAALERAPEDVRALNVVEHLLDVEGVRRDAATVLASRFASGGEARREAQALSVLLESADTREQKLSLVRRLMDVYDQKLSSTGTALTFALRALGEFPDELELWDVAEELAVRAGRPTDLIETLRTVLNAELPHELELSLCERAARVNEDRLGDPIGATPYLERILKLDVENDRAFGRLKDILTAAERWGELEDIYGRAIEATSQTPRKVEMLIEVALISEEILEDYHKAIEYYEKLLEIDAIHAVSLEALDRLYSRFEMHEKLASLLQKRLDLASGDESAQLRRRLAQLLLEQLHRPDQAMVLLQSLLSDNHNDREARSLTERLLEIGSLRAEAARALENVYLARDEIRDLVRVLSIQLECLESATESTAADDRRTLIRRIAVLRDTRLHDDQGAFESYARLVPLEPNDADVRHRLLEIGRRLGTLPAVAQAMAEAAKNAESSVAKAEILMQLAALHEQGLSDTTAAESCYRQIVNLDPDDVTVALPAAKQLERIYVAGSQSKQLAEVLRIEIKLEPNEQDRRRLRLRLGDLCRDVLGDVPGAISAYRACVAEQPDDDVALEALDGLYESTEAWPELLQVLEQRQNLATSEDAQRHLGVRRARLASDKLNDLDLSINVWRSLIDSLGPDAQALSALEVLYERQRAWQELADTLERHLDITTQGATELNLLAQLGDVRRIYLGNATAALDAYRHAIAVDPKHGPTRTALAAMLAHEEVPARKQAAEMLHPVLEAEQDWGRLAEVIDIQIASADDPVERLALLEKAAKVAEGEINDASRAFGYVVRGTREAVGHSDLAEWLVSLRRLAVASRQEAAQVALLREIVGDIFDGETQLAVLLEIAGMAQSALHDSALAREYFEKALEQNPENRTALMALEVIHEQAGDIRSLLDVTARRVETALNEEERKELLFRQAQLLNENLGERTQAIEVYERIIQSELDPRAVKALEQLYRSTSRWDSLVALYQRQAEVPGADLVAIHVATAIIWADNVGDVARALDELELALRGREPEASAVAALEKILGEAKDIESRARAATLLEPVYLMHGDFRRVIGTLKARLEATSDPTERKELLSRLAKIYEEQTEEFGEALETVALLFQEDPADEATQAELERLAKVSNAQARLAEIYAAILAKISGDDVVSARLAHRTADLYLANDAPEQALVFYSRAYAFDPENNALFMEVDALLQRLNRYAERVALYRKAIEHQFDFAARIESLHVIADLQRGPLNDVNAAIQTLREALEIDDAHPVTMDALAALYQQQGLFQELAQLLLRRAEGVVYPTESTGYRLALARLYVGELNEPERALDQLEEIVRYEPKHPGAIEMLEALRTNPQLRSRVVDVLRPLYESADDWQKLIRLNEDRFELADNVGDKVAVLRETATLYEVRGRDLERARQAFVFALEADPEDSGIRSEFERLTAATSQWEELRNTYERLLQSKPDLLCKRDLVETLAQTCDQRLDDPRRALALYWVLYDLEPGSLEIVEQIERLATLLSDWNSFVRALTEKAELLDAVEDQASCWRQIGEARRDMLEDPAGAILAYERALELEPDSAFTIDCLIELLEQTGGYERMVELLVRRMELCDDEAADEKYELLVRAADVTQVSIKDLGRATDLFVRALSLRPTDLVLLKRLEQLHTQQGLWSDLLDNLKVQCELSTDPTERARLRVRMGALLASELSNYDDALETYRQVFDDVPNDEAAIAALMTIAGGREELREAVAAILLPVLQSAGSFDRMVTVLESRLSGEHDDIQRCQTLQSIAEIQEVRLGNPRAALDSLLRAVTERPDEPSVHADVERLAESLNEWPKVRDVLRERAQATFDPDLACDLYTRLGRIAESKLDDPNLAEQAYTSALGQAGDRPELLQALDRIFTRLGNWRSLADILERRVAVEVDGRIQAELLVRLARIQIDQFEEPLRAVGSIRQVLDRVPEDETAISLLEDLTQQRELFEEAAEILESVYRASRRSERLAALLTKRVSLATDVTSRTEQRRNLAQVLEDECSDPARALDVLVDAIVENTGDAELLDSIERLAEVTNGYQKPVAALEQALQVRPPAAPEVARDVWVRLAGWQRDRIGDAAGAEKSFLHALEWDSSNDEILLQIEALRRAPGRERDLIETLRQRARLASSEDLRVELFQAAKQVATDLADAALAEAIVRELLSRDDANLWAITELTNLRRSAEDWPETLKLLLRRSELEADSRILYEVRYEAARVAKDRLDDKTTAIRLYAQLFDDDPMDAAAGSALKELLLETGDYQQLIQTLSRLVDVATTPEQRAELRMQLAVVHDEKLHDSQSAIAELLAVLEELPNHAPAVLALSKIYEELGANEEMADLLERQIRQADADNNQAAKIELLMRLAQVSESRLGDIGRALATYRSILESDAHNRSAIEALIRIHEGQGEHSDAAELLEVLIGIASGADRSRMGVRLADTRERLGDDASALQALKRVLADDPRNSEVRNRARSLSEKISDWDGVTTLLAEEADIVDAPADKVALLREAARIRGEKSQDWSAAAALLEKASAVAPNDRELLLSLCDAYTACGRAREAATALERIVESYGGRRTKELGEIHRRLALAYLSLGEPAKGKDELEKAFRIEPGNVRVIALLADVCLQIDDAKRAQQLYSSLIIQIPKLGPDSPISKAEIYAHRGEASRRLGEKQKAISDFERALQADPSMESVKAKLAELKS
jgi:tetratricopeptide (TPR) repeat protein